MTAPVHPSVHVERALADWLLRHDSDSLVEELRTAMTPADFADARYAAICQAVFAAASGTSPGPARSATVQRILDESLGGQAVLTAEDLLELDLDRPYVAAPRDWAGDVVRFSAARSLERLGQYIGAAAPASWAPCLDAAGVLLQKIAATISLAEHLADGTRVAARETRTPGHHVVHSIAGLPIHSGDRFAQALTPARRLLAEKAIVSLLLTYPASAVPFLDEFVPTDFASDRVVHLIDASRALRDRSVGINEASLLAQVWRTQAMSDHEWADLHTLVENSRATTMEFWAGSALARRYCAEVRIGRVVDQLGHAGESGVDLPGLVRRSAVLLTEARVAVDRLPGSATTRSAIPLPAAPARPAITATSTALRRSTTPPVQPQTRGG